MQGRGTQGRGMQGRGVEERSEEKNERSCCRRLCAPAALPRALLKSLSKALLRVRAALDADSTNPQRQTFEKMISGMYMGELVRRSMLSPKVAAGLSKACADSFTKAFRTQVGPRLLRHCAPTEWLR